MGWGSRQEVSYLHWFVLISFTAMEFVGKVVWVTGASSGIGEALVKNLAKCNARIAISARRKDELVRVKQECLGTSIVNCHPYRH